MDKRKRAEEFTRMVGMELKGAITSRGFNATEVAKLTGRSPAAYNRWLNGKVGIPMSVLCESCEVIGVEPQFIVETAYNRMAVAYGEVDGTTYDDDAKMEALSDRPGIVTLPTTPGSNVIALRAAMAGQKDNMPDTTTGEGSQLPPDEWED